MYKKRFQIFLITQVTILFGALFFPDDFFENTLQPILFLLNIIAGILLISKHKNVMWLFIALFIISAIIFGSNPDSKFLDKEIVFVRIAVYFLFHLVVTWNIIQQVWKTKNVNRNVIYGLMSGYISLGFLAFFIFLSIDLTHKNAFDGVLLNTGNIEVHSGTLMYYAFITLLTIGYGEVVPIAPIAQKAAILVGLMGQFYMVIVTAVVIEKYIRFSNNNN